MKTRLKCTVCGGETEGHQWWNQDIGTGVCRPCVDWMRNSGRESDECIKSYYGEDGINFPDAAGKVRSVLAPDRNV